MAEGITIEEVAQITDTDALWQLLRANQRVGIEATLGALLDEWRRRRSRPAGQS